MKKSAAAIVIASVYIILVIIGGVPNSCHAASVYFRPGAPDMAHYVNQMNTTWKANPHTKFQHMHEHAIKALMGVLSQSNPDATEHLETRTHAGLGSAYYTQLPPNFDARSRWPNCPSIGEVRDQGSCGSCWAISSSSVMTDRACIESNGEYTYPLSAQNLLSCCTNCGHGCKGGYPVSAWQWFARRGVVTGGYFNSVHNKSCQPYTVPPCNHHVNGSYGPCQSEGDYATPMCSNECASDYERSYDDDKVYAKTAYKINYNELQIQNEIYSHGPVVATLYVYSDFLNYKSGVYKRVAGHYMGLHAVKILGWGTDDNGVKYWIVANSWNNQWGDNGFVHILRGTNECGIESEIVAGSVKFQSQQQQQPQQQQQANNNPPNCRT